jgi:peptidoglycan/xylan/chitin deacetylase (PgdA/CDA1 family)
LQARGEFVDTSTCIDIICGDRELDGNYFHLSFDDGLRNNFTNAAPVLQDLDIPATFFVPSSLIGCDDSTAKYYSREVMNYDAPIRFMDWGQLEELVDQGFDIGSHTRHHARLSDLDDPDELRDEIRGSKNEIENTLGVSCKTISWPYGTRDDVNASALKACERAGYEVVFGAFRGTVAPGNADRLQVPRHQFEVQWPWPHVRFFAAGHLEDSA